MQPSPARDMVVGLFVLAGLGAVAYLSLQVGGLSYTGPEGFSLYATFDEIGGLTDRSPVVVAGVTVGRVDSIELDEYLRARVKLEIDPSVELPIDTSAAIRTQGLLGNQFVALDPGAEDALLESGQDVDYTESALSLEKLIGKFVNDTGLDE